MLRPPSIAYSCDFYISSADGSGGFDKAQLKKVEVAGGLSAKGYIPVMAIDEEVIRESSVCVERVAALSASIEGATTILPEHPEQSEELIRDCNALPKSCSSRELDEMIRKASSTFPRSCPSCFLRSFAMSQVDAILARNTFLAGETFSVADACLLPFLQRVESEIPNDATNAKGYMKRARQLPAFSKTVVSNWWWWW